MKKIFIVTLLFMSSLAASAQKFVINEIMAANVDCFVDPSQNYGSWIELYNPYLTSQSLQGLYVTDDPENLTKSKLRTDVESLSKNGYYVIWFDHYDGIFSPKQIDFKLNYEGGTIYITNGTEIICSQDYPKAIGRVSYARTRDNGTDWAWTANPTPGASNKASTFVGSPEKQLAPPVFDREPGFYTDPCNVTISSPDGADVYCTFSYYYSLEAPTRDSENCGSKYVLPLEGRTVVVRARAFKDGYLPSEVVTHSYIYKESGFVFPVISIATDYNNLYDNEIGVFEGGFSWWGEETCPYGRPGNGQSSNCNWNMDWDRPVNFEYINEKGEYVLNQEVDLSMCGGWSRANQPHSFKLKAAKYYLGKNSLDYPFFSSKPFIKNKVLQVRNGGNDGYCRIKDAAVQEVIRRSGVRINTQAWQPAHVFINGHYYSVLNIREPNNKHFAASNYGYDTDEIDQFEISPDSCYVQKVGTKEKFLEWYDLSYDAADPVVYSKICDMVDIEEYINYMAIELFACTNDWGRNNVKAFRHQNDGKFHFVLFDMDSVGDITGSPFNVLSSRQKDGDLDMLYGIWGVTPWNTGDRIKCENQFITIFLNMYNNEEFRSMFIDTFGVLGCSVFHTDNVKPIIDEMAKYMNSGLAYEGASSSQSASYVSGKFTETHQKNMMDYLKAFNKSRSFGTPSTFTMHIKSDIPEGEIFVNGIKVPTGKLDGVMVKPVTLRAAAPAGYRFLGWYKNIGGALISSDPEFSVTEISPRYTAKWEKMTPEEMKAEGLNPSPVVINEVSASNDIFINDLFKKADWIELYNTTDEPVNIAGMYLTDNPDKPQKYQIPTDDVRLNTIIPAHGYKIVWCDKKPSEGEAIHADFKIEADSGLVALTMYDGADIAYSDTVTYEYHDGEHSYGRYPDGGMNGYLMPRPTPGASNQCQSDVMAHLSSHPNATDIEEVKMSESTSSITIAYVGNGVINVKSADPLSVVKIYSSSGALIQSEQGSGTFQTVNLATLTNGIYVVVATDKANNAATLKFKR